VTLDPTVAPVGRESDVALRDQLSNLQGLLVLSMLMTESDDEEQIVHLAATAVPSLGRSRLQGVYLVGQGWHASAGPAIDAEVRADMEAQFAVLTKAGGAVAVIGEGWGWAFPLRSFAGHFGHLVVVADQEPAAAEQFLLRVLAQQSGIALANTRLHSRERANAAELRVANLALAETVAALQRSTEIHERLTRVAVLAEGQEGIAGAVHDLTGFPVAVEDRYGNLRAWAGDGRPDPYPKDPPAERERMLDRAVQAGHAIREGDRLVAAAMPRQDVLGVIALVDPERSAGEQEQVALEHGATVLAMELARLQSLAETELRLGRDLVDELLSGTDEERSLARAQALGYDLERPHRVLVVEGNDGAHGADGVANQDAFFHAVRRGVRDSGAGSLLAARAGTVVVLADAERPWESVRAAVVAEQGGGRCRLGVGGVCERPADFPRSYREARLALRMQEATGGGDAATEFDTLGVYRLLAEAEDVGTVERFASEWLGDLLHYDARKHSDLVATLSRYLECGRSYEATAKALAVHRSTLKYRLQRIGEISGHDLNDPDTSFNLQLATRAWHALSALRAV
jgi:DNA-binding PucR family transcriptional regulator